MNIPKLMLLVVVLLLAACYSETISPSRLFVKEIYDPLCYKDHFTFEDDQLKVYQRFFDNLEETTISFQYSEGKLVKIDHIRACGIESHIALVYNEKGQRQQEIVTFFANGEALSTRTGTFAYQGDELKSITYENSTPNSFKEEQEFHWASGNIIQIDFYVYFNNQRDFMYSRRYQYDNKLNYSNKDIAFIYTVGDKDETKISRNNCVSIKGSNAGEIEGPSYSFKYTKSGYPTEYTYKFDGRAFSPIQIRYY